jgi:hypothetical protein
MHAYPSDSVRAVVLVVATTLPCCVESNARTSDPSLPPPAATAPASGTDAGVGQTAPPPPTAAVAASPDASARVRPSGVLHFAANEFYCIDAAQDRTASRTPVRLFTCHGGENQRWTLSLDPNGSTSIAGMGGMCVDLRSAHPKDGANAQLSPCTGALDQLFVYDASGHLRDRASGKCLTATRAARGTPVVVEPCDPGNPGQAWTFADR